MPQIRNIWKNEDNFVTIITTQKNFAVIGVSGYIAPRHLKAVRDTGNRIIAALDRSDSVGILDSYSFDAAFFTEFERFDRYAERQRRLGDEKRIHYVSICSPNYLHDAHIRFALRIGADAICEKPLVLNPWNADALSELERETGKRVYNILQLRVHPAIIAMRERIRTSPPGKRHVVDLAYITSRGNWYFASWKGDESKSGGVATNIGIHFFDMLMWIFGAVKEYEVYHADARSMAGYLSLENADVRWFLSVDRGRLPAVAAGKSTYRSITVDGEEMEFSEGFTDLHTAVYREILAGRGFGTEDARPSINLVHDLRKAPVVCGSIDTRHPLLYAE
jgi:UDP-N-acetyl-2-amino-2-deoxyglucuronate dehydrogenase